MLSTLFYRKTNRSTQVELVRILSVSSKITRARIHLQASVSTRAHAVQVVAGWAGGRQQRLVDVEGASGEQIKEGDCRVSGWVGGAGMLQGCG